MGVMGTVSLATPLADVRSELHAPRDIAPTAKSAIHTARCEVVCRVMPSRYYCVAGRASGQRAVECVTVWRRLRNGAPRSNGATQLKYVGSSHQIVSEYFTPDDS